MWQETTTTVISETVTVERSQRKAASGREDILHQQVEITIIFVTININIPTNSFCLCCLILGCSLLYSACIFDIFLFSFARLCCGKRNVL